MKNSSINKLIDHLQHIYALPQIRKPLQQRIDDKQLKEEMAKHYRAHWKASGIVHENTHVNRLPISDLDNWQIYRINMSKRSYDYPKKFKGLKIPSVSRQFNSFNGRGKNGQIPYLYESDIPKIENLRQKIYSKPFKRTNTVRRQLFGFQQKTIPRSKSLAMHDQPNTLQNK